MKKTLSCSVSVTAVLLLATGARAQHDHAHDHGVPETLGTVDFPTSCRPEVSAAFTRATALLHSFGYEESRKGFEDVARRDPGCGIASWGIAMTYYHRSGRRPTERARRRPGGGREGRSRRRPGADRERDYIDAIGAFYREPDPRRAGRVVADRPWRTWPRRFPDDDEAAIFHALAILLATARRGRPELSRSRSRPPQILNRLLPLEPEHPGHRPLHDPFLRLSGARQRPSRRRARTRRSPRPRRTRCTCRPTSSHASGCGRSRSTPTSLRPPRAAAWWPKAHPGAASFDTLHALDYLEYAYLQVDDQGKAREVLEEAASARTFDEPNFAAGYALAAVPARFALERRDWKAAAALELPALDMPWPQYPYVPAITHFARALGAARSSQPGRARDALATLQQIQSELSKTPVPGPYDWAGNVESMRLAASGILAQAEGRNDEAVRLLRSAADLDEKTGKHPVTPGPILPPRELLADVLLESSHPAEALAEYEASLREAPDRGPLRPARSSRSAPRSSARTSGDSGASRLRWAVCGRRSSSARRVGSYVDLAR